MSATVARSKKITVDIPRSLYEETEAIVHEREISTSVFVREAMERYLRYIRHKKLEKDLEEGYLANASLTRQIHAEFALADADQE